MVNGWVGGDSRKIEAFSGKYVWNPYTSTRVEAILEKQQLFKMIFAPGESNHLNLSGILISDLIKVLSP